MSEKPPTADGYKPEQAAYVKATTLYVATLLQDLLDDYTVVGGLVPSLLIDQDSLPPEIAPHAGTADLDLAIALAVLTEQRYEAFSGRLKGAGFVPDEKEPGKITRQRWRIDGEARVTIDFLIEPSLEGDAGGQIRDIQPDLAAFIIPGLNLAFQNRHRVSLTGTTIMGEKATCDIWVCGAGAFVVLKALAFNVRGSRKDAYDLYYMLRNYKNGLRDVAEELEPLLDDPKAQEALTILREKFTDPDATGPKRATVFQTGADDEDLQADVVGHVLGLLAHFQRETP